ncbi:MAG TPA: hypothetical protein VMI06_17605 [Terriglobia bacterium]|nr:hypothetical protein [Terriglobia bacterium]
MKRDVGVAATLAALLMFFGFSTLRRQGAESPPVTSAREPTAPSAGAKAELESPYAPCTEIAMRLQRLSDTPEPWELPDFCYKSGRAPTRSNPPHLHLPGSGDPGVRLAIATVPNPVSTHLPLMSDRIIESIQQAAQDDGYSYDSSWFPWAAASQPFSALSDELTAARLREIRQNQPGVMVFRRGSERDGLYKSGLVVFLVGEQPAGGLSDDQFNHAVGWLERLTGSSPPNSLMILGPTFSGTLPSLERDLKRNLDHKGYQGTTEIDVSSGDVTDDASYHSFLDWFDCSKQNSLDQCPETTESGRGAKVVLPKGLSKTREARDGRRETKLAPLSYFRTAMEGDSLMVERLCDYLQAQGYKWSRVAELSEDETAFGANAGRSSSPSGCPALSLYYPRDISRLRTAYQKSSIFSSAGQGERQGAPSGELPGDLSEPADGDRDTIQYFSGASTPLAQESVLVDIANRLSSRQIQFVILRSTNSLDQIFLSEFLRRTYPQGRLVIDGADLLLTRGSWGGSLRGAMVLSTYPLLIEEQDWTPSLLAGQGTSYRTFGQDASEAEYIAAREIFSDPQQDPEGAASKDPKVVVPIRDYTAPAWATDPNNKDEDNQRPATWLTVIGHRRFWPVAVLNSYTLKDAGTQWTFLKDPATAPGILPTSSQRGDGAPLNNRHPPKVPFPLPLLTVLIAGLLCAVYHFYLCSSASIVGSPRARTYFAPMPEWQHPALIALGGLLLVMFAVSVAMACGLLPWRLYVGTFHQPQTGILLLLWLLLILALAVAGTYNNYNLRPLGGDQSKLRRGLWHSRAALGAMVCFALFVWEKVHLAVNLSPANAFPAFWRSVNLVSGVSPLLPQLLLIAGMYVWFWCALRGLAHFGQDRPVLPKEADLPVLNDAERTKMMPMLSREHAGDLVERRARPWDFKPPLRLLHPEYAVFLAVLFLLSVLLCGLALGGVSLPTLGELAYGRFIFFWICLCIAIILADAVQLWRVWKQLHQLLLHLDRLPLQRTLRAFKGLEWGSIWKMSGNVLEERYRMITLQIQSLRHLRNLLDKAQGTGAGNPAVSRRIGKLLHVDLPGLAKWYAELNSGEPVQGVKPLRDFQEKLAGMGGLVMKEMLLAAWRHETESLMVDQPTLDKKIGGDESKETAVSAGHIPPQVRAAEEFVVLQYLAFIQNIFGRLRTMVLGILSLFVGTTLAVASYPFEPVDVLGGIFLVVFVSTGCLIVVVYAQMCRDATLSYITDTKPGQLGWDFWFRLAAFGIGPLAGLLATLFPSISDFVFSWLQPSVQALH